jgi:FlhB-like protein
MSESKKNKAVALRYSMEEDAAPIVIASGYGHIADRIIDIAENQGIPVFRDDSAASMLCMLEVGKTIPPELYEIVAAIYVQLLKTSDSIKHGLTGVTGSGR